MNAENNKNKIEKNEKNNLENFSLGVSPLIIDRDLITVVTDKDGITKESISWDAERGLVEAIVFHISRNLDEEQLLSSIDKKISLKDTHGRNIIAAILKRLYKLESVEPTEATINYLIDNDVIERLTELDIFGHNLIQLIDSWALNILKEETALKIIKKIGVNSLDAQGDTAISSFNSFANQEMFDLFLRAGADTKLKNNNGETIAYTHAHEILKFVNSMNGKIADREHYINVLNRIVQVFEKNTFSIYKGMERVANFEGKTCVSLLEEIVEKGKTIDGADEAIDSLRTILDKFKLEQELKIVEPTLELSQNKFKV